MFKHFMDSDYFLTDRLETHFFFPPHTSPQALEQAAPRGDEVTIPRGIQGTNRRHISDLVYWP